METMCLIKIMLSAEEADATQFESLYKIQIFITLNAVDLSQDSFVNQEF